MRLLCYIIYVKPHLDGARTHTQRRQAEEVRLRNTPIDDCVRTERERESSIQFKYKRSTRTLDNYMYVVVVS